MQPLKLGQKMAGPEVAFCAYSISENISPRESRLGSGLGGGGFNWKARGHSLLLPDPYIQINSIIAWKP